LHPNPVQTALDGCDFVGNRAARGGAVAWSVDHGAFALASIEFVQLLGGPNLADTDVKPEGWPLLRWPVLYDKRSDYAPSARARFERNDAAAGDGGALALSGSGSVFALLGALIAGNTATEGGAGASVASGDGVLLFVASLLNNTAASVGGAGLLVAGGGGLNVTVTNSRLAGNRALGAGSAGGGLCCHACGAVRLEGGAFEGNSAGAYGGGAAVVRAGGPVVVDGCEFRANIASPPPPPGGGAPRRLQAAAAAADGLGDGAGPRAGAAGPDPANVTMDDGRYPGGGGLYASAAAGLELRRSIFVGNVGANGGERGRRGCGCGAGAFGGHRSPSRVATGAGRAGRPRAVLSGCPARLHQVASPPGPISATPPPLRPARSASAWCWPAA
jgi:hypothetical protein